MSSLFPFFLNSGAAVPNPLSKTGDVTTLRLVVLKSCLSISSIASNSRPLRSFEPKNGMRNQTNPKISMWDQNLRARHTVRHASYGWQNEMGTNAHDVEP